MQSKNGGIRPGSGRKPGFPGEKTVLIRIPETQESLIKRFLDAYRERKSEKITYEERFMYELENHKLRIGLISAIEYLQSSFPHIPIVHLKIATLKNILAHSKPKIPLSMLSWEKDSYSPSGIPLKISAKIIDKKISFCSESFRHFHKDHHEYKLNLKNTEELINYLISVCHLLD